MIVNYMTSFVFLFSSCCKILLWRFVRYRVLLFTSAELAEQTTFNCSMWKCCTVLEGSVRSKWCQGKPKRLALWHQAVAGGGVVIGTVGEIGSGQKLLEMPHKGMVDSYCRLLMRTAMNMKWTSEMQWIEVNSCSTWDFIFWKCVEIQISDSVLLTW